MRQRDVTAGNIEPVSQGAEVVLPTKIRVVFDGNEPSVGGVFKTTGRLPKTRYESSNTSLIAKETEIGSDDETIKTSSPVNCRAIEEEKERMITTRRCKK